MMCKHCGGASFVERGDVLVCSYCTSTFLKEEFAPRTDDFVVCGGTLTMYKGNKSQVIIPEGVVSIAENAFKNNLLITKVTFSSTVQVIGKSAFAGCVNLLEIENYRSVSTFGDECFYGAGLESVEIGSNVCLLGNRCFANMPNLNTVTYTPNKDLKLCKTFANCKNLFQVNADKFYFFPSFHGFREIQNNPTNKRYTYSDAFPGTPYMHSIKAQLFEMYKKGECPECGGIIKKRLFHAKCKNCGIDYKN